MNTYWISLPCDLLSSLASFQCSLLHHLHLSSDLGLSKYVNQHSHLNLSRNVRLSVLYDLDFNIFDLLNDAVKDHQRVQTWIKSFLAKRDGRGAWIAFKAHYLGSSQMDTIASTTEDKLLTSQYHGERPRYDFAWHVSVHQKADIDIEKATGTPLSG